MIALGCHSRPSTLLRINSGGPVRRSSPMANEGGNPAKNMDSCFRRNDTIDLATHRGYYKLLLLATIILLSLFCGCANTDKTPEAAVRYFWAAMAKGDRQAVLKTQIYYKTGMTSEFINTPENIDWLYLDSMTTVYESDSRADVYYQVVFKKKDSEKITSYKTGTLTIKKNNNWKIAKVIGAKKE